MWHQRSWVRIPSSTQKPMQMHRLFLCKTGFEAAQHGVLGVFCLIRTELARGRKKQKCPKMPQALSCVSPAKNKALNCISQAFKGPRGERQWECAARQGEHNPALREWRSLNPTLWECRRPNPLFCPPLWPAFCIPSPIQSNP